MLNFRRLNFWWTLLPHENFPLYGRTNIVIVLVRHDFHSLVIPAVNSSEDVYIVNEIDGVTFNCTSTGIPPPTLLWFKEGSLLNDSDSRVNIGDAGNQLLTSLLYQVTQNLTIYNTSSEDTGNYSCFAGNDAGSDKALFELVVRSECFEG